MGNLIKVLDNKGFGKAVDLMDLIDLSKAFNTISDELLIAKLHAIWFQQ